MVELGVYFGTKSSVNYHRCQFHKFITSGVGARLYGRGGEKARAKRWGLGLHHARPWRGWRRVARQGVARTHGCPVEVHREGGASWV